MPSENKSPIVPSVNLYFPSWGIALPKETRMTNRRVWGSNQIWVEGVSSPFAIQVSFTVLSDNASVEFPRKTIPSDVLLGELPTGEGKKLWVSAHVRTEANMREMVEEAFSKIGGDDIERLTGDDTGEPLSFLLAGTSDSGTRFLIQIPVEVVKKEVP